MLQLVKTALRIKTEAYDSELSMMIDACYADLGIAGVEVADKESLPIVQLAVCTYCKIHFGPHDNVDRLQASYDEQKAQLSMSTGFTDWSGADV